MPFAFFFVPAGASPGVASELNQFLASRNVLRVTREWCEERGTVGWAFCVEYQGAAEGPARVAGRVGEREGRPDYKLLLPPEQFAVFTQLRDARLALAARDKVASFVVFTNDQLYQLVRRGCRTLEDVKAIHGVGEDRLTKYAPEMLRILNAGRGAAAGAGAGVGAQEAGA